MNAPKFELLENDTIKIETGETLYRIRALRKVFGGVDTGSLGGYVESERNLSHSGSAWIARNAKVYGCAQVIGNAWISDNAQICDNAHVEGDAKIYGDAKVSGYAWISGNAKIHGDVKVFGEVWISDNAQICDSAQVFDKAKVYGNAQVCDNAWIYGTTRVHDNTRVAGNARAFNFTQVYGNAYVSGDAWLQNKGDVIWFTPVGSELGTLTAVKTRDGGIHITRGCFSGTVAEFLDAVYKKHGTTKIAQEYRLLIEAACLRFNYVMPKVNIEERSTV